MFCCYALQGFSNGMPEQADMHATIFNLAVMHGGNRTYTAMQKLYREVTLCSFTSVGFRCRDHNVTYPLMTRTCVWKSHVAFVPCPWWSGEM